MDYSSLVGIAVGLSMDALAASVANGTAVRKMTPGSALKVGPIFGLFQALTPCLDWALGAAGANLLTRIEHWLALLLLTYLGTQMTWGSYSGEYAKEARCHTVGKRVLLIQAVATSINMLATGIILPSSVGIRSVPQMIFSVSLIRIIILALYFAGIYLGRKFGCLLSGRAEIAGGIILILAGIKIFAEYLLTSA